MVHEDMENKPNRIIWHHTGAGGATPQFTRTDRYHKSRGFPRSALGFYGGYHVLIEKDGAARRYRDDEEVGAHDAGENVNSIGIALAGNFNVELPTEPQTAAFRELLLQTMNRWKIPADRIDPHRFGDTTDCPGTNLADTWARDLVAAAPAAACDEVLQEIVDFVQSKRHAPR